MAVYGKVAAFGGCENAGDARAEGYCYILTPVYFTTTTTAATATAMARRSAALAADEIAFAALPWDEVRDVEDDGTGVVRRWSREDEYVRPEKLCVQDVRARSVEAAVAAA